MLVQKVDRKIQNILCTISDSPTLESEILICHVLNKDKIWFELNQKYTISEDDILKIDALIEKRLQNIPLEYLTNNRFFYNHLFHVNTSTLIPRPETEILVNEAIRAIQEMAITKNQNHISVLEIGAGSGCIPISIIDSLLSDTIISNQTLNINIVSTEISNDAIDVILKNVKNLINYTNFQQIGINSYEFVISKKNINIFFKIIKADIISTEEIRLSDYLSSLGIDLLISNPPYIPSNNLLNLPENVKKEPVIALDGGKDGLELIRRIIEETMPFSIPDKSKYLIEFDTSTKKILDLYIRQKYPKIYRSYIKDLTGRERFLELHI